MPTFKYKSATSAGEVLEGEIEAVSHTAVIEKLHAQGQIPIRAEEITLTKPQRARTPRGVFLSNKITEKDVTNFTLELSTLLDAGVSLDNALSILSQLSVPGPMRRLLEEIHADVRRGVDLSEALQAQGPVFSRFYVNLIRAGEAGSALESTLGRLADFLERAKEIKEAVISALIYPAILVVLAIASILMILTFVVPKFAELFDDAGAALPWQTQVVINLGTFFQMYWWLLLLGVAVNYVTAKQVLKDPQSKLEWDRLVLRSPIVGSFTKRVEAARFTRTLGILLASGVTMIDALTVAKETVNNHAIRRGLGRVIDGIRDGRSMAQTLTSAQVFPPLACHLVQVGEETGKLEEMLLKIASIYEAEVRATLQRMVVVLEPVLILVLALVIAAIIFSILIAVLSINDLAI